MKVLAVIDTNVIISALLSKYADSATVQLFDCIFYGIMIPVYDDDILNEYDAVLRRRRFNFSEELIVKTLSAIKAKGIHSERITVEESLPDPKDLVFYEVALSVDESYLVTGNIKHFPKKPFIVTPTEMMSIIKEMMLSSDKRILNDPLAEYGRF